MSDVCISFLEPGSFSLGGSDALKTVPARKSILSGICES